VAEIDAVSVSADRTFQTALAKPYAEFNRLTEVFLVWPTTVSNQDE
jgi:cell shape-determining protein MreC